MEESTPADPGHRHAQTQRVPQNHTHTSTVHVLPLNLHGAREVITTYLETRLVHVALASELTGDPNKDM